MNSTVYFAPLQSFTTVPYCLSFAKIVGGIDKYFTPFYRADKKGNFSLEKYLFGRTYINIVPQVLSNEAEELLTFAYHMLDRGFDEMNFNLGCPFPMIVNRRLGSGLLPYPRKIDKILAAFFHENIPIKLSLKLRLGLNDTGESAQVLEVIKQYPIEEIILHPRLGVQKYKGHPDWDTFAALSRTYDFIANGDIMTVAQLMNLQQRFSNVRVWMVGRGLLRNPCMFKDGLDWKQTMMKLHDLFLDYLREFGFTEHQILNQLKCFWEYPSQYPEGGSRIFRKMRKVGHFDDYLLLKDRLLI